MKLEPDENFLAHIPGIWDEPDEADEAAADARAMTEMDAGKFISNKAVMKWLASWGTGNRLPRPQVGD